MGSIPNNPKIDNGYFEYSITIGPVDYKRSIYNGMLMTSGILGTTFILGKIGEKKYTPSLSMKDYFSLGLVSVLSQLSIDYGKGKGWLPSGLK